MKNIHIYVWICLLVISFETAKGQSTPTFVYGLKLMPKARRHAEMLKDTLRKIDTILMPLRNEVLRTKRELSSLLAEVSRLKKELPKLNDTISACLNRDIPLQKLLSMTLPLIEQRDSLRKRQEVVFHILPLELDSFEYFHTVDSVTAKKLGRLNLSRELFKTLTGLLYDEMMPQSQILIKGRREKRNYIFVF